MNCECQTVNDGGQIGRPHHPCAKILPFRYSGTLVTPCNHATM